MTKVSVIVPIYNVAEYLPRCIESLCNQSFADFELILVDDGSTDSSAEICDKYAYEDDRIQVIHKQNGGLSDARNAGMQAATGEFTVFVDSDDWVHFEYLQILYDSITTNGCDIVECNIIRTKEYQIHDERINSGDNEIRVYSTEDAWKELICDHEFHQYVWNKIYRTNLIRNIPFAVGKCNEDEFWTYQVFGSGQRIGRIKPALYYYYQRPGSIMKSHYSLRRLDALEAKCNRQDYIEQKFPALSGIAAVNLFASCIYQGQMILLSLHGEDLHRAQKIVAERIRYRTPKYEEYSNLILKERIYITSAKISFWGTCRIRNFLKIGF